jgi:hypothetical protein
MGEASVRKPQLFHVPFWHLRAQVHGYTVGIEPEFVEEEIPVVPVDETQPGWTMTPTRKVKRRSGSRAVEREIHVSSTVNVSAADLEPLGIPSLSSETQLAMDGLEIQGSGLPDGLEVLDSRVSYRGTFVDPTIQVSDAVAQSEKYARRLATGVGRGLEKRWEFSVVAGRRCSLIYYPIWVIAFLYRGVGYHVVVDGRSGRVVRGRLPGRGGDRRILTAAAGALWAAAVPLSVDLGMLMLTPEWRLQRAPGACFGVLLALLVGAGVLTYRFIEAMTDLQRATTEEYRI